MILKLEALGGDGIEDCSQEALRIANMLNITVEFDFNEVSVMARPGRDLAEMIGAWFLAVKNKKKFA